MNNNSVRNNPRVIYTGEPYIRYVYTAAPYIRYVYTAAPYIRYVYAAAPYIRYVYTAAPYIRYVSERVSSILKKYGIHLCHKPSNKLINHLCNFKDRRKPSTQAGVVYKLCCNDC